MNREQVAQIRKKIRAGLFSWGNRGGVVRRRMAAGLSVCRRLAAVSGYASWSEALTKAAVFQEPPAPSGRDNILLQQVGVCSHTPT